MIRRLIGAAAGPAAIVSTAQQMASPRVLDDSRQIYNAADDGSLRLPRGAFTDYLREALRQRVPLKSSAH